MPLSDTGFGIVPRYLRGRLSMAEMAVYVALSWRADEFGECWPSIPTLERDAGCSANTVRSALRGLRDKGIITQSERASLDGSQESNVYRLIVYRDVGQFAAEQNGLSDPSSKFEPSPLHDLEYPPSNFEPLPLQGLPSEQNGLSTPPSKFEPSPLHDLEYPPSNFEPERESLELEPGLASVGAPARERPGQVGPGFADADHRRTDGAIADDYALARAVLPEAWVGRLDAQMVCLVALKVRARVQRGWNTDQIRRIVTEKALPSEVRSLGRLLAARIEDIPVECAPPAPVRGLAGAGPLCVDCGLDREGHEAGNLRVAEVLRHPWASSGDEAELVGASALEVSR